jgi:hypothetical protein
MRIPVLNGERRTVLMAVPNMQAGIRENVKGFRNTWGFQKRRL